MNAGVRHSVQRSNRVRLKADAAYLLDRIISDAPDCLPTRLKLHIQEMRLRLQPSPGKRAPINLTGYTK